VLGSEFKGICTAPLLVQKDLKVAISNGSRVPRKLEAIQSAVGCTQHEG